MAVTMSQVRAALDPEEPNYPKAAQLGPQALTHLKKLIAEAEPMLASKATHLAALIAGEGAVELLRAATNHPETIVRVAAAGAARVLPAEAAGEVLVPLLSDSDPGVRRAAMKSVPAEQSESLRTAIEGMGQRDPDPGLRAMSLSTLGQRQAPGGLQRVPGEPISGMGEGGGDLGGSSPQSDPSLQDRGAGTGEGGGDFTGSARSSNAGIDGHGLSGAASVTRATAGPHNGGDGGGELSADCGCGST
jgi:hypothetical protein